MDITISDKAKALFALEEERAALYSRALTLTTKQVTIMTAAAQEVRVLSNDHTLILLKLAELEKAFDALTGVAYKRHMQSVRAGMARRAKGLTREEAYEQVVGLSRVNDMEVEKRSPCQLHDFDFPNEEKLK